MILSMHVNGARLQTFPTWVNSYAWKGSFQTTIASAHVSSNSLEVLRSTALVSMTLVFARFPAFRSGCICREGGSHARIAIRFKSFPLGPGHFPIGITFFGICNRSAVDVLYI